MRIVKLVCFSLLFSVALASSRAGSPLPPASENPPAPQVIVIGFLGGYVEPDDAIHSEVQLISHLREDYSEGVYVAAFENHTREDAYREILRLLDTDHDGKLSPEEKRNARIIIFGHSWGGHETVMLARELDMDDIPVLLTIQVDSIHKRHQDDRVIPANVAQAINFFQFDGIVHGRRDIRAADPDRTRILGNIRFDYVHNPIKCDAYPGYARFLARPHIEIECDPTVWTRVENLIRAKLPPINHTISARRFN